MIPNNYIEIVGSVENLSVGIIPINKTIPESIMLGKAGSRGWSVQLTNIKGSIRVSGIGLAHASRVSLLGYTDDDANNHYIEAWSQGIHTFQIIYGGGLF